MILLTIVLLGLAYSGFVTTAHATTVLLSGSLVNMITDPFRSRLYVADSSAGIVVVLNTTTDNVITTMSVGSRPYGMDVSADGKEMYVALRGESALGIVSLGNLTVSRKIPLTAQPFDVVAGPPGLAYVTTNENFGYPRVVDTVKNRELGKIVSAGQIYESSLIRISSDRKYLYVGQGGGLSYAAIWQFLIQGTNATLLRTADGGSNLGDFAVNPEGSRIYVASGAPYDISVFSTSNMSLIGELQTSSYPNSVGLAQNGRLVFATHASSDVKSFNATSFGLVNAYPTSYYAVQVRPREDGKKVYLMTGGYYEGNTRYVEVLDTVPDTISPAWPAGSSLKALSIGASTANLTWTRAEDDVRVAGYQLYENSSLVVSLDRSMTSYLVTGLLPDRGYLFQMEATDSAGLQSVNGPMAALRTLPDTTPPVWPAGSSLSAVSTTPNSVVLTWTRVTDDVAVAAYRVYSNNAVLNTITVSTWEANSGQYTAGGLTPQTTYHFRVEAGDTSSNWSTDGPSLNVTTPAVSNITYTGSVLKVESSYLNTPYAGGSVTLENIFTSLGTDPVLVMGLTMRGDLGAWTMQGSPFELLGGHGRTIDMTVTIPRSVYTGNHPVTVNVQWQGYDPQTGVWSYATPLTFSGTIPVQPPPPTTPPPSMTKQNNTILLGLLESLLSSDGLLIAVGTAVLVGASTLTVVLVARKSNSSPARTRWGGYCSGCGQVNGTYARFCGNCGSPLGTL